MEEAVRPGDGNVSRLFGLRETCRAFIENYNEARAQAEKSEEQKLGMTAIVAHARAETWARAVALVAADPQWDALASIHTKRLQEHRELIEAFEAFVALSNT